MKEAFEFYMFIKHHAQPLGDTTRVLDFGVGWGRIARFFLKEIKPENMVGVDVDPEIIECCRKIALPIDLHLINADGGLPDECDSFDLAYAFSVFSHLSKAATERWLIALCGAIRPGGTLVFTSLPLRTLQLFAACKRKPATERNSYEEAFANYFPDPEDAIRQFEDGYHVYSPTGGNSEAMKDYGWAAAPMRFVEQTIGSLCSNISMIDDQVVCEQAVFVATRR